MSFTTRLVSSARFRAFATAFPLTRPIARRRARALFDLCAGFVYSQVLLALVRLRVPELLLAEPRNATSLALALSLPQPAMERLLLAAVSLDLLRRGRDGRYALGRLGSALIDNPGLTGMIEHHRLLYDDLRDPVALLRGRAGSLAGYWPYSTADAEPAARYSGLMSATQPMIAAEVLALAPLRGRRCLLDVGGGDGSFLIAALRRHRALHGMVFDLAPVVALATARLAEAGLGDRARAVAGDFTGDPLPEGADVVSLVRVLHDHDDPVALALLVRIRAALPPGGMLLLAEPMAETPGSEPMGDAYFGFYLLAMGSGRPRSPARIAELLTQAGFERIRLMRTRTPLLVRMMTASVGMVGPRK